MTGDCRGSGSRLRPHALPHDGGAIRRDVTGDESGTLDIDGC
jgi:hypothetical protein